MRKKFLIVLLVLLTAALGFLRDHIFVSINQAIEAGNDPEGKLLKLKWVLTAFFSLLYMLDTCILLYVIFQSKKIIRITLLAYTSLFAVSLIIAGFACIFSDFSTVYHFIRAILGIAQSPVILMFLVPAFYIYQRGLQVENGNKN